MIVDSLSFESVEPPYYWSNGPRSVGPCQFTNQKIEAPSVGDIVRLPIEELNNAFVVVLREFYYIRKFCTINEIDTVPTLTCNVYVRPALQEDYLVIPRG